MIYMKEFSPFKFCIKGNEVYLYYKRYDEYISPYYEVIYRKKVKSFREGLLLLKKIFLKIQEKRSTQVR